jgi:ABC-type histidine transport system ATPase subunit
MTMLLATHHLLFALGLSYRLIFLREGQVIQDAGPSDLMTCPACADVEQYLNVLDAVG